jgi:putative salt-induced outer membrane protein YdiY
MTVFLPGYHFPWLACVLALALGAAACSRASILVLSNGDRLTGKVIKRENGKVYFHSDILGDLVARENVVTILEQPPAPSGAALAGVPPQPAPKPPPHKPIVVVAPSPPWTGKVEVGYDNFVTNVRAVTATLRAEADRTAGPDALQIKGDFLYGSSDGTANTDQEDASFRWRHNLTDRVFTQAQTSYDSDKIRLIRYNFDQNLGLGYELFQTLRQKVDVGPGVNVQDLDASGVQEGFGYFGNLFQDYSYKISGRYTFLEDASFDYSPETRGVYGFAPSLGVPLNTTARDYSYKVETTLQGKITSRLSLNFHFEYNFDNAVLDPASRLEQRITTTLGYGF